MGKRFFSTRLACSNIKNNRRFYLPYIISAVGTIMMFYIISALGPGIQIESMYGGSVVMETLKLGVNVIAVFAVIFLFYTNSFIIKRRKKELGLYNILGMEKKHISRIIALETIIVAAVSLAVGLLFGVLFSKLMFMLLGKIIGADIPIDFLVPAESVGNTVILFAVIFFLTLLYNLLQIIRAKPIELLHGGEFGEKEPKANWFLAVLGAALLGTGYYLSVSIQSPLEALLLFMVAVILVILGTYCLFTAGMTVVLKVLKKRKKFYYQSRHFTTVSGMIYRMKQNAAGLATICILSTCVLVMVSTTFSMYASMEDILRTRYPRDIAVTVNAADEKLAAEISAAIEEEIQKAGVTAENTVQKRSITVPAVLEGNTFDYSSETSLSNIGILDFIPLEEYNKNRVEPLTLAPDEVFIYANRGGYEGATVSLYGMEFRARSIDDTYTSGDQNARADTTYVVILPDFQTIRAVLRPLEREGFEPFEELVYHRSFDLAEKDAGKEIELAGAVRYRVSELTEDYFVESAEASKSDFIMLYGGLFFLGIFLGLVFMMALVLIIYYKQVSEGYDDKRRFEIMQNVGMSHSEVKRSIHSQIMMVFFIPLVTAVIHLCFAMPMLIKILSVMNLTNVQLILLSTGGVTVLFTIVYVIVYLLTARTYYKIVER